MLGQVPRRWGATEPEAARAYPADGLLGHKHTLSLTRAITVAAPATLAYRWLCQIRVAPYSYDLLDNLGRRSPQQVTPGADDLHIGDDVMVFRVAEVQPGRSWSGVMQPRLERLFGRVAVTYAVEPLDERTSRLLCRLVVARSRGLRRARSYLLGWGDLIMMRKQFLNLKRLAERDARTGSPVVGSVRAHGD